jgi:hypothetical protein
MEQLLSNIVDYELSILSKIKHYCFNSIKLHDNIYLHNNVELTKKLTNIVFELHASISYHNALKNSKNIKPEVNMMLNDNLMSDIRYYLNKIKPILTHPNIKFIIYANNSGYLYNLDLLDAYLNLNYTSHKYQGVCSNNKHVIQISSVDKYIYTIKDGGTKFYIFDKKNVPLASFEIETYSNCRNCFDVRYSEKGLFVHIYPFQLYTCPNDYELKKESIIVQIIIDNDLEL